MVPSLNGPIVTKIRALLTPPTCQELRIKSKYIHQKEVKGAMGLKIAASGLENVVAGSELHAIDTSTNSIDFTDEIERVKQNAIKDLTDGLLGAKEDIGIHVQASSLGSLEALISFLKKNEIPIASFGLGPIHKKDILKAKSMRDKRKEYAVILAFDVGVSHEIDEAYYSDIKVFQSDVIYRLVEDFQNYLEKVKEQRKSQLKGEMVWPAIVKVLPYVFNAKSPIIIGVEVMEGVLHKDTPLCLQNNQEVLLGTVSSIEKNNKEIDTAKVGDQVAIKIEGSNYAHGRHFDEGDILLSQISRKSLDVLKEFYREDISRDQTKLLFKLKKILGVE